MKREWEWFRAGSGLALSLLFLIVLPACSTPLIEVKVDAQCGPEAMKDNQPPTGRKCIKDHTGKCVANCPC